MAVGTDRRAGAVVLKRAEAAGSRTGGRRYGLDDDERERKCQNRFDRHGHSPVVEAEAASADWIGERCVYFGARIRMECAGTSPRVRDDVHRSHRRHLQHHGIVMDWACRARSKALLPMSGECAELSKERFRKNAGNKSRRS
jgi:hypothetical protein